MTDILNERHKTHGDYYHNAATAQALKDEMRRGMNWKSLDDMQRETLEMVATKIGRILSGDPHEPDHWKDIAGYAQLIVNAYNACGDGPTRRHGECNPATPVPSQAASAS
jgi:hypothetical protein